jgi:hypothetical protein
MANDSIPASKAELMSLIDREWSALMDVVEKLSPEQMHTPDEGGWTPKDNLAHLAVWMNILLGYHIDRRPAHEVAGVSPEAAADWDFNVMNEIFFERHRDQPLEEVLYELKKTYERVRARLDAMSYEDLMKPRREDDHEKRPILIWILGDTSDHFAEHRETIEKMLNS